MKLISIVACSILFISACESTTSIVNNLTAPTPVLTPTSTQTSTNPTCPTCPTQPCSTGTTCTGTGQNPSLRLPEITSFSADSSRISSKSGTFLRWDISDSNATVRIDPGIGSVGPVGFIFINPSVTTTYTLTARNNIGTVQRTFIVVVFNPES